jgi:ketosteroid isomerase-like protein
VIESWAKAVRDVDIEGILARHTDDIVMFDVPPPLQVRGKEAYRKTWELFFKYSSGGEGSFDLRELEITAGDSVAFAHALLDVAGSTARLTIGLRRSGEIGSSLMSTIRIHRSRSDHAHSLWRTSFAVSPDEASDACEGGTLP